MLAHADLERLPVPSVLMVEAKTAARVVLETAHGTAAQACGRLALILASGRGLTQVTIKETAAGFNAAAASLLTLVKEKT